tara:strand:- start:878 stop:3781 length:2904 start_codon:yes stop_codon:yes gene_type:complete
MKKILFISLLTSICCWSQESLLNKATSSKAQTTQYISLDSLNKIHDQNYAFGKQVSQKVNSKIFHGFLKVLDRQKQIHQLNNENQEGIKELQAKTLIALMLYVHAKDNLDSIDYYQKKIVLLTNKPSLLGESLGISAYTYQQNDLYFEALKKYENVIKIYENSNIKKTKYRIINPLVNLNACLRKLGSIEHLKITNAKLSKAINGFTGHPRYENLKELVKIEQAYVLIESKKYKDALIIAKSIEFSKLDKSLLLKRYYNLLHKIFKSLKSYNLGEDYLEKVYNSEEYIEKPFIVKDDYYFINKLQYAIHNNNTKNADYYFKIILDLKGSTTSYYRLFNNEKIISNYYEFKNDYKKAYVHLKESNLLINSSNREKAKLRLDVDHFYVQLDIELKKLKQVNLMKDQLITENRFFYINILIGVLFFIIIIFTFVRSFHKRKQYRLELEYQSTKIIADAKQVFLENMSHEIRTPITTIMGYLMLLKENTLNPKKSSQYVNLALNNSQQMITSLNSYLTLLVSEKKLFRSKKTNFYKFNFYLKEIISFYEADFIIKNINFYYKTNMLDTLIINYDFESLKIIITNIITNAIKYSNANSSIYFTVNLTETAIQITIKDSGFGIAEDDKEKIFTRFYQSKNNMSIGGFGIGLSLVSDLIKDLKGTIQLISEINIGSVFYIDLPYKAEKHSLYTVSKKVDFKLLSQDKTIEKDTKDTNNFPKILIVDDNLVMVKFLTNLFSSFLDCTLAFNGQEALLKVKKESFDIIISDLRMPMMDGTQLKAALNKIDVYKDIPFIMITSVFYDKLKDLKNTLGLDEYIEKPFTKNEILSRVQFALERSVYRKKIFTTDNVTIDFEGSQTELIEKIKESILSNLSNSNFNVQLLAQMCGYEQKKLNTILKSKLGLSIVNIILEVRMLKAYELIIKNIHPTLNEVIYAVGMNSRSYFSKRFEERFGIKAGDLKRKHDSLIIENNE